MVSIYIEPTIVSEFNDWPRIIAIKSISEVNFVSLDFPMFKHVVNRPVVAVKESRLGILLHFPDALLDLLHHLLLAHGRGDAHVDGVGLPLLTRNTRFLKSLNEGI